MASAISDAKGGMKAQRKRFAHYATKLLKDNNNKLPKRNECSDKRHRFMYQRKRQWKGRCWDRCKAPHKDATLAKFAILNF